METHLLVCESCQGELDFMRLLVAGVRSLPAAQPPPDFQARVMARWQQERDEPARPELVLLPGGTASAAGPPQAWGPPRPSAYGPPPAARPAYAIKPFYGLAAALFAVIFVVGMLTGKNYYGPEAVKTAGVVPNLKQVADQLKQGFDLTLLPGEQKATGEQKLTAAPAAAAMADNECPGRTNEWNRTRLRMVVREPLKDYLQRAEVAVWVPESVTVDYNSSEYSSGQLLLIPVHVGENGEWQASLRWRTGRPGRFDAWVETRCEGIYQHRPIVFNATAP